MTRARNIKPGFFGNEVLAECDPLARLFFAGLWCHADREGRLEWRPRKLKVAILPYDECNAEDLISQLDQRNFIIRYDGENGIQFVQIVNFVKHQNPHHMEPPSEYPPPPGHANKFNHSPISPKQRARIYQRDKHRCVLCGATDNLQVDHITMVSQGGTSDDDNLRTLCAQCNNKRSKRPVNPLILDSLNLIPDPLKPTTAPRKREADDSVEFQKFWEAWPNRVGKGQARHALRGALRKADLETILLGIGRYVRDRPSDRPWCHPATWLNGERWLDEPAERTSPQPSRTTPGGPSDLLPTSAPSWPVLVKGYREKGFWMPQWGPKPGEPGCRVPAELLRH